MTPPDQPDLDDFLEKGLSAAFSADESSASGGIAAAMIPDRETPIPTGVGRYPVDEVVGRGGIGLVLKVLDPELGRSLALKILHSSFAEDPEMVRRFEEEARIASRLQHPGVVPVHELGRCDDGRPYFTMKLIEGETFSAFLGARRTPEEDRPRLLDIFGKVCQTIAYAHTRDVVHLDLKPENVMVGRFGEVQVMDWGFARRHGRDQGRSSRVVGTPAYMAPEQARGETERIDARSDVFALGAMLCEILTGSPPYVGESRSETLLMASRAWIKDAWTRIEGSGADSTLIHLVRSCLAAEPEDRPADAGAVAAKIAAYQAAVEERTRSLELAAAEARARAAEERRARRLTVALALSVVLALLLGGGAYFWIDHDRRARASETALAVDAALQKVHLLRAEARGGRGGAERISEAVVAAEQIAAFAQARHAAASTQHRIRELVAGLRTERDTARRDLATAERLLDIRPHIGDERSALRQDADYAAAFRDHGIDIDRLDLEAAASAIDASSIRHQLVAALDDWIYVARNPQLVDPTRADRLRDLADLADGDPWRRKLRAADAAGDIDGLRNLAEAVEDQDVGPESLELLGRCLFRVGDEEAAIRVYRLAHWRHPSDFWVNHNLAWLLRHRPDAPQDEVARLFAMAVAVRPDSVHALADLGFSLMIMGDYPNALRCLDRARGLQPDYAPVWLYRGVIQLRRGEHEAAVASLGEAVALDGRSFQARLYLGQALASAGRLVDAAAAAREALKLSPRDLAALSLRCSILAEQRDYAGLVAAARALLEKHPDHVPGWYLLGLGLQACFETEAAQKAYLRAIELDPRQAEAWCNLGLLLVREGRFEEGCERLRRGHELGTERGASWSYPSELWIERAEALLESAGRLDAVERGAAEATTLQDRATLAEAAFLRRRLALALRLFSEVFAEDPLIPDLESPSYRELAAGAAATLSSGSEARRADPAGRAGLLRRALEWMREDLERRREALEAGFVAPAFILEVLWRWRHDPALAALRAPEAWADLGEEERAALSAFWEEVASEEAELQGRQTPP